MRSPVSAVFLQLLLLILVAALTVPVNSRSAGAPGQQGLLRRAREEGDLHRDGSGARNDNGGSGASVVRQGHNNRHGQGAKEAHGAESFNDLVAAGAAIGASKGRPKSLLERHAARGSERRERRLARRANGTRASGRKSNGTRARKAAANASLLAEGQQPAGGEGEGEEEDERSPEEICKDLLDSEKPLARFTFKLSNPGELCGGPGGWRALDDKCESHGNCRIMCRMANCRLQFSSRGCGDKKGCVDDTQIVESNPNLPGGCILNMEEKKVKFNAMSGSMAVDPKFRSFCYVEAASMQKGYALYHGDYASICAQDESGKHMPKVVLGWGQSMSMCARLVSQRFLRYMEHSILQGRCVGFLHCPHQKICTSEDEGCDRWALKGRIYSVLIPQVLRATVSGVIGRKGPTQEDVDYFSLPGLMQVVDGYQMYRVTHTSKYRFSLAGARGGMHGRKGFGGNGALINGVLDLKATDRIIVLVGQKGWDNYAGGDWGGGGGGASMLLIENMEPPDMSLPPNARAKSMNIIEKFGIDVKLVAIASGGAGLESRKLHDTAPIGTGETEENRTRGAFGGRAGGGGSYKAEAMGGGKPAQALLFGGMGGGIPDSTEHFGGFGGGGGPFNGAGGGGGFAGGDCNKGGTDNECFGGSSVCGAAGCEILPGSNPGDGFFTLEQVKKQEKRKRALEVEAGESDIDAEGEEKAKKDDEEGSDDEDGEFECYRDDEVFFSLRMIDFDFGCNPVVSKCPNEVDLGQRFVSLGVYFTQTKNFAHPWSYSPYACARNGDLEKLGSKPMQMEFMYPIVRLGFFYFGEDPVLKVTIEGVNKQEKTYSLGDVKADKPNAYSFFGIRGVGIKKVKIEGKSYCIDDLRWIDEDRRLWDGHLDFADGLKGAETKNEPYLFPVPNGAKVLVHGWKNGISKEHNGFICENCQDSSLMRFTAYNLQPMAAYRYAIWSFGYPLEKPYRTKFNPILWTLTVNGDLGSQKVGATRKCKFPGRDGRDLHEDYWLPRCGPNLLGDAYANPDGEIEFHFQQLKGQGTMALSGLAVYAPKNPKTTTTTTAPLGLFLDESKCSDFVLQNWTLKAFTHTDAGRVHGLFPIDKAEWAERIIGILPVHDTMLVSMRFWALDNWNAFNYGTVWLDGLERWTKFRRPGTCNEAGWKPYLGIFPTPMMIKFGSAANNSGALEAERYRCYTELAAGMSHKATYLNFKLAVTSNMDLAHTKDGRWGFSHVHVMVGMDTKVVDEEKSKAKDDWDTGDMYRGPRHFFTINETIKAHGLYPASAVLSKTFTGLGRHDYVKLRMRFWLIGNWQAADAVIRADGVEVFRKRRYRDRKVNPHLAVDLALWPQYEGLQAAKAVGQQNAVYFTDVETVFPHTDNFTTIEIRTEIDTNGNGGLWGFHNFELLAGGEVDRCREELCRDGLTLKDGPPWCSGRCTEDMCCIPLGVCSAGFCATQRAGALLKQYVPRFCKAKNCLLSECCDLKGRCTPKVCYDAIYFRPKEYWDHYFCAGAECKPDECCNRATICHPGICPEGMISKVPYPMCDEKVCTIDECCIPLGRCPRLGTFANAELCPPRNFVPALPPPRFCAKPECTRGECCTKRDDCLIYECPNKALKRKAVRNMPTKCKGRLCDFEECCENVGICTIEVCADFGMALADNRVEACADKKCKKWECCIAYGTCKETKCNPGWIPKLNTSKHCKFHECKQEECCNYVGGAGGDTAMTLVERRTASEADLLDHARSSLDIIEDHLPLGAVEWLMNSYGRRSVISGSLLWLLASLAARAT